MLKLFGTSHLPLAFFPKLKCCELDEIVTASICWENFLSCIENLNGAVHEKDNTKNPTHFDRKIFENSSNCVKKYKDQS